MIKINFINQYDKKKTYQKAVKSIYKNGYKELGLVEPLVVSVIFVDDQTIHELKPIVTSINQPMF